jgi:hypothetical protein
MPIYCDWKGFIGLDDKYKIRNFKVLDLAIQYLSIWLRNAKVMQEQEAQNSRFNLTKHWASQQAEQFKQQTAQLQGFDAQKATSYYKWCYIWKVSVESKTDWL